MEIHSTYVNLKNYTISENKDKISVNPSGAETWIIPDEYINTVVEPDQLIFTCQVPGGRISITCVD